MPDTIVYKGYAINIHQDVAFLQNNTQCLYDFDPDRAVNATPRAWEYVLRLNGDALPEHLYLAAMSGIIPEGIAATYLGFRKVAARFPNKAEIERSPHTAPVPTDIDVLYAVCASMIVTTRDANAFEHYMGYITRLPREFQTLYVHTCIKRVPDVSGSPTYVQWVSNNRQQFGSK